MNELRKVGVFCFKVHGGPTMMAGLPDIVACVDGRFVGFETKLPESIDNVSSRQAYVHERIADAGGSVYVVTSVDAALAIVKRMRAAAK